MRWGPVVTLLAIAAVVWWRTHEPGVSAAAVAPSDGPEQDDRSTPSFRCEGKTYCSEMSSCEEATFYLQHCPGVKMDGDNDGIPCEKQFCR